MIIIDLETGPLPVERLAGVMPEFEADRRLKDPEKIAADLAGQKEAWINKAALSATTGEVLAIGKLYLDQVISVNTNENGEKALIEGFWKNYGATTETVVGHNIKGFDLPFLIRRSWILGIQIPPGLMTGKYLCQRFVDTMEIWQCGNYRDMISLDNLAKALGCGAKTGKGADFAMLYGAGPDGKKAALDYLKNDLELTAKVAKKMGVI